MGGQARRYVVPEGLPNLFVDARVTHDGEALPAGHQEDEHAVVVGSVLHAEPMEGLPRSLLHIPPEKVRYRTPDLPGGDPLRLPDGLHHPHLVHALPQASAAHAHHAIPPFLTMIPRLPRR